MISFRKWVEAVVHDNSKYKEDTELEDILLKALSKKESIQLGIEAVENVLRYQDDEFAREAIELAKKHLANPNLDNEEIQRLIDSHDYDNTVDVIFAAVSVLNAITSPNYNLVALNIKRAVSYSIHAIYSITLDPQTYVKERDRVFSRAKSLLSKSNIGKKPTMGQAMNVNDYASIAALLDELEEEGEDIITPTPDGKLRLNLPKGYDIIGNNKMEIVQQIMNPRNKWVVNWLQRMYS